ncbi:MAG: PD40 domain-containing protein [Acidobacteria bacterium]|nr:PD40 domain-containing protein [Acidobacteriota bacterium]
MAALLFLAVAAGGPSPAAAAPYAPPPGPLAGPVRQGPSGPWRTLTTPHFRVHFPAPFAAWATRAAAGLEALRDREIAEIGFAPAEVVDVVVSDPEADANGAAFPLRGWPRLVLWTSPAPPDSEIGNYRDAIEDLVVHEEAHLVHLLRPSRSPWLGRLLPTGPIALGPRWLAEGYATVIEGKLTGSGRPNGDLRAAILRRWAQGGHLPSYGRLAADEHSWRGMSMAYLVGSSFLEWLEQRAGPGSLRKLWARMTARVGRGFDEAFAGIWENSPESLYDRFRAELTWRAMEAERRVQAVGPLAVREGALWQSLTWTTGAPALSPDGTRLALVRRSRERPPELVVWATAPDQEAERRWQEAQARQQAKDPQDVPALRTRPLPRKPLYTWVAAGGGDPAMPRFLPGGKSLLLVRAMPDGEGFLHPDLFEWRPETGGMRRITRQADLRDPDPSPDGTWAVAVRDRFGLSQLVTVDLASGETRELTAPSLDRLYDRPRLAPDGGRVAFGLHAGGAWKLGVLELGPGRAAGGETELAPPPGGTASSPAWSPDGRTLYAVVGRGGFIDIYAFAARQPGAAPVALTRTQGGAFAPAPTPDGKGLFYLSLEPDGLDLRRLDLGAQRPPLPEVAMPSDLAPAVRPAAPAASPPPLSALSPLSTAISPSPLILSPPPSGPPPGPPPASGQPYGLGRQELLPLAGGAAGNAGGTLELGVRSGDLLGRLDVLALAGIGTAGAPRGGALAAAFRGLPVELGLHAFDVRELPSRQSGQADAPPRGPAPPAAPGTPETGALDLERRGLEAAAEWRRQAAGERFRLRAALLWQRLEAAALPSRAAEQEGLAAAEGELRLSRRHGLWRLDPSLGARLAGGRSGGGSWARYGGEAALAVRRRDTRLELDWRRDGSQRVRRVFDLYQLGGPASSLLPPAALAARLVSPALPAATLLGAEHEEERAEIELGPLPVPLFYERHRLWGGLLRRPAEVTLAGLELRLSTRPVPLVRLPAVELRTGAARVFSGLPDERTRWWLTTVWRP